MSTSPCTTSVASYDMRPSLLTPLGKPYLALMMLISRTAGLTIIMWCGMVLFFRTSRQIVPKCPSMRYRMRSCLGFSGLGSTPPNS